ncbi:MAG: ABC transporter permease [Alcaligenaceae bacterium]|nr:ABC transporter permease [Alcaligenaceae bacterium]
MPDFSRALSQRLLHSLPTVAGILILNFLLLQQVPGDAVDIMAGEAGGATVESMAAMRQAYGMDGSLFERLHAYLANLLQGNLGVSPRFNAPVTTLILERLPNSLFLVMSGLLLAVVSGIAIGTVMAAFAGRLPDRLLSLLNLVLYSTPGFWIGLLLILLFSVHLGWLPANGHASIGVELNGLAWLKDRAWYAVLPTITVATFFIAVYARLTRAAMLEVKDLDFIRTARAKGLHPARITVRHTLRNALLPVSTMAGVHFAALFGGAAVTETVFGWPGLGRLTLDAVMTRDFNLLLGILLFSSFVVVVVNILIDLLQQWLDPRTRTS